MSYRVDADCVYFAKAWMAAPKGEKRLAVTVDGNIGAGKSTVIDGVLQKATASLSAGTLVIVPEPLDRMMPLLKRLARPDESEEAQGDTIYKLQVLMRDHFHGVKKRLKAFKRYGEGACQVILVERNAAMSAVFIKLARNKLKRKRYEELLAAVRQNLVDWDLRILVDTPPCICAERILARGRAAEKWLTTKEGPGLNYLRALQEGMESNCQSNETTRFDGKMPSEDLQEILFYHLFMKPLPR